MRACDWNRLVWLTRGFRFDEQGNLMTKEKKAAAKPPRATESARSEEEAGSEEGGDSGEGERDLALSGDSGSDSGTHRTLKKTTAERK
jgi:hypothetical protein